MLVTNWQQKEQPPDEFQGKLPEFPTLTRNLLWQRGLRDQGAIDEFFNPDYSSDLHDPFLLKNSRKAIDRIFKALENKEKVMVFGDYDADGVCGATIIQEALKAIGFSTDNLGIYLPDREKEGYGLKVPAAEQFIQEGYDLIITIDCGTMSHEAVDLAFKNGIDTIVIDHHRVVGEPPKCAAFVNPHQEGEEYPFKDLCGAGVAFKIACALFKELRVRCMSGLKDSGPHIGCVNCVSEGQEKWLLDLAAIATITDVMPLLGENRTIVKYGLFVLAQTQRIGLKALMEVCGIKPAIEQESLSTNINPFTVGFVLGPRINAAGRMDHANSAFMLLNSKSQEEASELARKINKSNRERQELVERIVSEVEQRLSKKDEAPLIFEGSASWSIGVAGIVAGKISEKYSRPAFIYQIKDDGTCAGSVRTIPGFNVVKSLEFVKDILLNFGGHPQAGGFTVSNDKVEEMKKRIEEFTRENLKAEDFNKRIEYDMELDYNDISWQSHDDIEKFQPFGEANREPVFLMKNVKVLSVDVLQKNNGNGNVNPKKHLRMFLDIQGASKKAMAFGVGDRGDDIRVGENVDILFSFAIDEWNGNRELMLKVADFRVSDYGK